MTAILAATLGKAITGDARPRADAIASYGLDIGTEW